MITDHGYRKSPAGPIGGARRGRHELLMAAYYHTVTTDHSYRKSLQDITVAAVGDGGR